jgi:hypothetical protein
MALRHSARFLKTIIDAFPALVMVVDDDVKILECNAAAEQFLDKERKGILLYRCGEVFQCMHSSEVPEGCGRAPFCSECIARNSVIKAFQGKAVVRRRGKMEIVREGKNEQFYALITATPFTYNDVDMVLLIIEDINEIVELQRLVPICMKCKKIRDDNQYWVAVESYFKRHWDLDFSHGICPECQKGEQEKIDREIERLSRIAPTSPVFSRGRKKTEETAPS